MTEPKDDFDAAFENAQSGNDSGKELNENGDSDSDLLDSPSLSEKDEEVDSEESPDSSGGALLGKIKRSLQFGIVLTAAVILVAGGAYFLLVEEEAVPEKEIASAQNETPGSTLTEEARGRQSGLGLDSETALVIKDESADSEDATEPEKPAAGELLPSKFFLRGLKIPRGRVVVWVDGVLLGPLKKKRRVVVVQEGNHVIRVVTTSKGKRSELSGEVTTRQGQDSVVTVNFRKQTIEQEVKGARKKQGT